MSEKSNNEIYEKFKKVAYTDSPIHEVYDEIKKDILSLEPEELSSLIIDMYYENPDNLLGCVGSHTQQINQYIANDKLVFLNALKSKAKQNTSPHDLRKHGLDDPVYVNKMIALANLVADKSDLLTRYKSQKNPAFYEKDAHVLDYFLKKESDDHVFTYFDKMIKVPERDLDLTSLAEICDFFDQLDTKDFSEDHLNKMAEYEGLFDKKLASLAYAELCIAAKDDDSLSGLVNRKSKQTDDVLDMLSKQAEALSTRLSINTRQDKDGIHEVDGWAIKKSIDELKNAIEKSKAIFEKIKSYDFQNQEQEINEIIKHAHDALSHGMGKNIQNMDVLTRIRINILLLLDYLLANLFVKEKVIDARQSIASAVTEILGGDFETRNMVGKASDHQDDFNTTSKIIMAINDKIDRVFKEEDKAVFDQVVDFVKKPAYDLLVCCSILEASYWAAYALNEFGPGSYLGFSGNHGQDGVDIFRGCIIGVLGAEIGSELVNRHFNNNSDNRMSP